jgi:uncharacterized protein
MKSVFLDTGYLIALEASDDQNHATAQSHWRGFSRRLPPLVTTSLVFTEVVTFFNTRGQHSKAVELGNMLLGSATVELVHADEFLLLSGWEWFQQYADKSFSLADCVSFVVMRQRRLERALAFDRHFIQAGFQLFP